MHNEIKAKTPRVVDNYFPDWIVERVSKDLEYFPVTYTNSPYRDFKRCRFFGNMLMEEDQWILLVIIQDQIFLNFL